MYRKLVDNRAKLCYNSSINIAHGHMHGRKIMEETKIPPLSDDEFADDDIVTLMSATGEEIDFVEIAGIAHKGNFYAILQPVELLEGMDDDEALVFKVSRGPDGEDKFEIELDDEIIDAVFQEYNRLLDKVQSEQE